MTSLGANGRSQPGSRHLKLVQPYSKGEQAGNGDAKAETKAIPAAVRAQVLERDGHSCRVCGAYAKDPAIHHISYRSEGGLHVVENLVTVHWMYEPRCHERAHSDKGLWQPLLAEVVKHDGLTAMGLLRAYRASQGPS